LKATAELALIDDVTTYPGVITQAAPASTVAKAFIKNGVTDKITNFFV